jgi:hypothetical protein
VARLEGVSGSRLAIAAALRPLSAATFGLAGARAATPVRGLSGDLWADVVVGQPEFGQITPNQVTARRLFNPGGDRRSLR